MATTYNYIDKWSDDITLAFTKDNYHIGNDTAIEAVCRVYDEDISDTPYWEGYVPVTVNLPMYEHSEPGAVFLNTNNAKHLITWMVDNGLIRLTGYAAQSGFCAYAEGVPSQELLNSCMSRQEAYC